MQSERWKRIDELLDAAMDLEPHERNQFLEQNCLGDQELKNEVEALLAFDEKAKKFIETPAYEGAEGLLDPPPSRLSESQLLSNGRYEILNSLGSGGMGEVYRAKDLRLGREVAIKVLPARMANDENASKRFEREATALAALSHQNILSIFDFGADDDTTYVVMELLKGETLRKRLRNGPLPWPETAKIAISIQEGLSAAHSKGLIHRDLKPENVFVTSEGIVKILDFGLAVFDKPAPEELPGTPVLSPQSNSSLRMGTIGYMSPEQLRASRVDARSDLFSFGCILYEMLSGKKPFDGKNTAETIESILKDDPPSISQTAKDFPQKLNEIARRCLKKNPEDRYQTARDVGMDLKKVIEASPVQITSRKSSPAIWAAAILMVLLTAGMIVMLRNKINVSNVENENVRKIKTIAILPFRPLVIDKRDEVLELGMADTLITRLGNAKSITVRPLNSVRNFVGPNQDPIKAGKTLQVESVLDGSMQRSADRIHVNVRLMRVDNGSEIWKGTFDEKYTDIFTVQDTIAAKIASALAFQLRADERSGLEKHYTTSPEAYEFYLRGRYHSYKLFEEDLRKGIGFYELAVTADPNYALAYADMADSYRRLGIPGFAPAKVVFVQAKSLAKKALELDETLPQGYVVLGWIDFLYEWDWNAAENKLKRGLELSPNNSDSHLAYAHFLSCVGRHEEAIAEVRVARNLSPTTLILRTMESQFLLYAGRQEESIQQAKKALDLDPNFWVALNQLGRAYCFQKRYNEAIIELKKAKQLAPGSVEPIMQLGYVYAAMGDPKKAYVILDEMNRESKTRFVSFYSFAMIYNGLGNSAKAIDFLDKSVENREVQLTFLKIDPRWNNLRSDPRFMKILKEVNL